MGREEFEAQVEAARDDAGALFRLCEDLQARPEPWARTLRMRAIAQRLRLRKANQASQPVVRAGPAWMADLGLQIPDGRPLYRYKVSTDQFVRAQSALRQRIPIMLVRRQVSDAALFVLWAAEWFRRSYQGGLQRWDDLGDEIGLHLDQASWRDLADKGLRFWGIPPLSLNGMHLRLSAIARQGGFPIAALQGDNAGWARRYLERLTGLLLGDPQPDLSRADLFAKSLEDMIPPTWRHDGMRTVCGELALQVVLLRREAEAGGAVSGSLVSAWLDINRPNWRDELPLVIEDGGSLVDGLMRTIPLKGGGGSIRATRLLVRESEGWRERTRLDLQGALRDVDGKAVLGKLSEEWSRLRLYPAGEFARHASGELAVVEPGDAGDWIARPTGGRTDFDLPAHVSIDVELRGEGRRVCPPFSIPHGGRLPSGVRACIGESDETDGVPGQLTITGTGSGSYRPDQLYLDVPVGWTVEPADADARSDELEALTADGRRLWRVAGTVWIRSSRGDLYLVRCGQAADRRDSLALIGATPRGCTGPDPQLPLIAGMPRFELRENGRVRNASAGEGRWRPAGTREWLRLSDGECQGHCEFAWLDARTGHVRDRAEAIILPPEFSVVRTNVGDSVEFHINGWSGNVSWPNARQTSSGRWRIPRFGERGAASDVRLFGAEEDPITIRVPIPHQAWISHWSQGPTQRNARLSIATLNQFVARSEHACELMADLLDAQRRPVPQGQVSWWVDGELPLSAIRDDLTALLRPVNDLRAQIRLNFNDGNEDYWFVSEFDTALEIHGARLIPERAIAEIVRVVGRPLHDPARERDDFPNYAPVIGGHRPIEIPHLKGEWLLYLRSDDRIVSEPRRIEGTPLAVPLNTPLARAMAITNWRERNAALDQLCLEIAADPSSQRSQNVLAMIIDLAKSLDGLRAGTFDILGKTATHAGLGPLLLFNAGPADLDAVIQLSEGLPLVWATIPHRHWFAASQAKFEQLLTMMPDQIAAIGRVISERRKAIVERDEALAPLLELTSGPQPLRDVVQAFLNRSTDRAQSTLANPFRPEHDALIPRWEFPEHYWRALDAPIVAAAAAAERCTLSLPQLYCVKDVARRHPRYFRDAFAASLPES